MGGVSESLAANIDPGAKLLRHRPHYTLQCSLRSVFILSPQNSNSISEDDAAIRPTK
jgi:hypothetical protein